MSLLALSRELSRLVSQVVPGIVTLSGRCGDQDVSGSGFLIDRDGYAVTNHHVVAEFGLGFAVTLADGVTTHGSVIGVDRSTDLALIKVEKAPRSHLRLRKKPAQLGELCLVLGSPLGTFRESVSIGLVSGVDRTVPQEPGRPIFGAIQTDCAINPGNSGGPLVDVRGQVLGVNTCCVRDTEGLGFAIPASTVQSVVRELKASGRVRRATLGVAVKQALRRVDGTAVAGVEVTGVSSSRKVGLKRGDVILTIDGTRVHKTHQIFAILTSAHIGRATPVDVLRRGARHRVVVEPREWRTDG